MELSEARRLRELEDENAKLEWLLAVAMLDHAGLTVAASHVGRCSRLIEENKRFRVDAAPYHAPALGM